MKAQEINEYSRSYPRAFIDRTAEMSEKKCICGDAILSSRSKYCSDQCAKVTNKVRQRERYKVHLLMTAVQYAAELINKGRGNIAAKHLLNRLEETRKDLPTRKNRKNPVSDQVLS